MDIYLSYLGELQTITGTNRETVTLQVGAVFADLMDNLGKIYGPEFRREVDQEDRYEILINGQNHKALDGDQTVLKSGDMVVFMRITVGG